MSWMKAWCCSVPDDDIARCTSHAPSPKAAQAADPWYTLLLSSSAPSVRPPPSTAHTTSPRASQGSLNGTVDTDRPRRQILHFPARDTRPRLSDDTRQRAHCLRHSSFATLLAISRD
ncbi:hypothetical protein OPT61_g7861 [Boeremia exigua]|uniref:Uncharacterized protein n=1 Tax=Boeremia exigua TaxID=749465 RepID=A0ACC2I0Y3_9PLEO|nr:hypothetical protein OPT61_g7861 [Boeremia exigua]